MARPQESDRLSSALRRAYGAAGEIGVEFRHLLHELDRRTSRR